MKPALMIATCLAFAVSGNAFSAENCFQNAVLDHPQDISNLIHKVAVYGDHDKRKTLDDFAAAENIDPDELKAKTAASGALDCNGFGGYAQLVFKSDILVTAAHTFHDVRTCAEKSKPTQCTFTYEFMGKTISVPVASMIKDGSVCPLDQNARDDWAILRLAKPIPGVIPYRLPKDEQIKSMKSKKSVIAVARSADFCKHDLKTGKCMFDGAGNVIMPKFIERCQTSTVEVNFGDPAYFTSNCDASQGASGGTILDSDLTYPTLMGIISGSDETDKQVAQAIRTGKPIMKPFSDANWAEGQVAVAGDLLDAIRDAGK